MAFSRLPKLVVVGVLLAQMPSIAGQGPPDEGSTSTTSSGPPPPDMTTSTSSTSGGSPPPDEGSTSTSSGPPPPDMTTSASGNLSPSGAPSSSGGTLPPGTPPPGQGSSMGEGDPPSNSSSMEGGNGEVDYDPSLYPELCSMAGYDADYDEYFSGMGDSTTRQVLSNTSCANHVNYGVDKGPDLHFPARHYASNTSIPAFPYLSGNGSTTDLSSTNGQIGILGNGVALYSAFAGEVVTDWESTAMAAEYLTFDACGSHSTVEGRYHHHGTPGCFLEQVMKFEGKGYQEHSPRLGYAFDGLPVYGPFGPDGASMLACGESGADETYCLDVCSGYEGELPGVDSFKYRYYLTCGFTEAFFPGAVNCFRGCCPDGIACADTVEDCDLSAEPGYTEDYAPEISQNFTTQYDTDFLEGDDREYINTTTSVDCAAYYNDSDDSSLVTPTIEPISLSSLDSGATPSPTSASEAADAADTSNGCSKRGSTTTGAILYVVLGVALFVAG